MRNLKETKIYYINIKTMEQKTSFTKKLAPKFPFLCLIKGQISNSKNKSIAHKKQIIQ